MSKVIGSSIILILLIVAFEYQNCMGGGDSVRFSNVRGSLNSQMGGESYDGKPSPGKYCRVYDELACRPQVTGLQSLLNVDAKGLHLEQDNCATTSTNFLLDDAAVKYSPLLGEYIGVSRGIFKKCEVGANELPITPEEMPDAYCVSEDNHLAAVVNKNLKNSQLDLSLAYESSNGLRRVSASNLVRRISANGEVVYTSLNSKFDLTITPSVAQTAVARVNVIVDNVAIEKKLICRTSSPLPTVIIERDLELSSTWIDTTQLVGYWKLNEPNAVEGTTIVDSSRFASSGTLLTGSDGLVKSVSGVAGGSLFFDGTSDSVDIQNPSDGHLSFDVRSFTYMVWMNKTGNTGGNYDMPLFHGGSSDGVAGYDFECGSSCGAHISDGLSLPTSIQSARFGFSGSGTAATFIGRWVLLTAVVDRDLQQLRSYVDGVLIFTADISQVGSLSSSRNLQLGTSIGGSYFWGLIDDVAIWNKALSESEIKEIFQRLRPKFY